MLCLFHLKFYDYLPADDNIGTSTALERSRARYLHVHSSARGPLSDVADLLGHSSLHTTKVNEEDLTAYKILRAVQRLYSVDITPN